MKYFNCLIAIGLVTCVTTAQADDTCDAVLAYGAGRGSVDIQFLVTLRQEYENVCQQGAKKSGTSLSAEIFKQTIGITNTEEAHTLFCRTFNKNEFKNFFYYRDLRPVSDSVVAGWRDCKRFNGSGDKPYYLELLGTQFTVHFAPAAGSADIKLGGFTAVADRSQPTQPLLTCQIRKDGEGNQEFKANGSVTIKKGDSATLTCVRAQIRHPNDRTNYFPATTVTFSNNVRMPGITLPESPSDENQSEIEKLQKQIDELTRVQNSLAKWQGLEMPGNWTSVDPSRNQGQAYKCPDDSFVVGRQFESGSARERFLCRKLLPDGAK